MKSGGKMEKQKWNFFLTKLVSLATSEATTCSGSSEVANFDLYRPHLKMADANNIVAPI